MSPEKETNLFLVFKTHTLQKVGKKDVFPVGKNLVDVLLFEINIGHRGDLSAAHTGHQKRVLYLRNGAMHSHAALTVEPPKRVRMAFEPVPTPHAALLRKPVKPDPKF